MLGTIAGMICGSEGFRSLSCEHGIKIHVGLFGCLAVGELVECDSMKAGSRRNNADVMFLDSMDKVNSLVERGVVLRKIILSNLPTIGNDVLLQEL